jgi:hypothetical protein
LDLLRLPDGFWAREDVGRALAQRDFGALFRLISKYAGASQTQIAIAAGMTQGQVSTIMAGTRRITAIDVAERVFDGMMAPDAARVAYGLAPRGSFTNVVALVLVRRTSSSRIPLQAVKANQRGKRTCSGVTSCGSVARWRRRRYPAV